MTSLLSHYNHIFDHIGITANIENKSITILFSASDEQYDIGDGRLVVGLTKIEVRQSEMMEPKIGELISVNSTDYKIISEPCLDHMSKIWTLTAIQV